MIERNVHETSFGVDPNRVGPMPGLQSAEDQLLLGFLSFLSFVLFLDMDFTNSVFQMPLGNILQLQQVHR